MENYHPIVIITYFISVFVFSSIFMHPLTLIIGLVSGLCYSLMLKGVKSLKFNFIYIFPLILIAVFINPLINHTGVTVLIYFPNGSPLTLESVIYGAASAVMLWVIMCFFSCFNTVMTSEKLMYLLGILAPGLSLVLSMVLRFVPRFRIQLRTITNAQKCIGADISSGSLKQRFKNAVKILSVMITWSLENAADTADSMKSRGYGLSNRTAYSNFRMTSRDIIVLLYIGLLVLYISCCAMLKKAFYFSYYPSIGIDGIYVDNLGAFVSYGLLFACPVFIEFWETMKWKKLKSRI